MIRNQQITQKLLQFKGREVPDDSVEELRKKIDKDPDLIGIDIDMNIEKVSPFQSMLDGVNFYIRSLNDPDTTMRVKDLMSIEDANL